MTSLHFFNVLQTQGLQEIGNENFEATVKEVESRFMSVISSCFNIFAWLTLSLVINDCSLYPRPLVLNMVYFDSD